MKKNLKLTLKTLLLSSLLIFVSCEDRIQVKIDKQKNLLTVDAFINNLNQTQKIRLTYTDSYFSGTTPPPLEGATVIVTDLTVNKHYTFTDQRDGNYTYAQGVDSMVTAGHSYQLNVQFDNYTYKAITVGKRSTKIESLSFQYMEANTSLLGATKAGHRLLLMAKDAEGPEADYYWVKLYKNGKFFSRPQNMQLESFGNNNEADGMYFLPDRWRAAGPEPGADTVVTGDVARLEIHGISREAFDFLSVGVQMGSNNGLFAVTPVNLPTNIYPADTESPKAVGLFNVSEVSFQETTCP
jgi:hypothetical protein